MSIISKELKVDATLSVVAFIAVLSISIAIIGLINNKNEGSYFILFPILIISAVIFIHLAKKHYKINKKIEFIQMAINEMIEDYSEQEDVKKY